MRQIISNILFFICLEEKGNCLTSTRGNFSKANSTSYHNHFLMAADYQCILNQYIQESKNNDNFPIKWTSEVEEVFLKCKVNIINATTVTHL